MTRHPVSEGCAEDPGTRTPRPDDILTLTQVRKLFLRPNGRPVSAEIILRWSGWGVLPGLDRRDRSQVRLKSMPGTPFLFLRRDVERFAVAAIDALVRMGVHPGNLIGFGLDPQVWLPIPAPLAAEPSQEGGADAPSH